MEELQQQLLRISNALVEGNKWSVQDSWLVISTVVSGSAALVTGILAFLTFRISQQVSAIETERLESERPSLTGYVKPSWDHDFVTYQIFLANDGSRPIHVYNVMYVNDAGVEIPLLPYNDYEFAPIHFTGHSIHKFKISEHLWLTEEGNFEGPKRIKVWSSLQPDAHEFDVWKA